MSTLDFSHAAFFVTASLASLMAWIRWDIGVAAVLFCTLGAFYQLAMLTHSK